MKHFLIALLTDSQGRPDEQAIISLVGAAVFFALEIYSVTMRGQIFDALTYGAGVGTLLGATSAGFGLRARLTPNTRNPGDIDPANGNFIGGINARTAP